VRTSSTIPTLVLVLAVLSPGAVLAEEVSRLPSPAWIEEPTDPPVFLEPQVRELGGYLSAEPGESKLDTNDAMVARLLRAEVTPLGGQIDDDRHGLFVRGPKEVRDLARRRVLAMREWLRGRTVIHVAAHRLDSPPTGAEEALAALDRGEGEPLFAFRLETRRGGITLAQDLSTRTFLSGLKAEVAQEASIAEPQPALLVTGNRVAVHCRPISSRAAVATLSLQISRLTGIDAVRTASGPVDLPEVRLLSFYGAIRLTKGQPRLLLFDHPFGEGSLAVLVTLSSVPDADGLPCALVDLAALAGWPDAAKTHFAAGVRGVEAEPRPTPVTPTREDGYTASEEMTEWLGQGGTDAWVLSPNLVAVTGEAKLVEEKIAELHRALARGEGLLRRAVLRKKWGQLTREAWFDAATGELDVDRSAREEWHTDLRLPFLAHTPVLLLRGTWRRFLVGQKVEIAQAAAVFQPQVGTLFEGEALCLARSEHDPTPSISRTTSRLVDYERRELPVRKDVLGRRTAEGDHLVDLLGTSESFQEIRLDGRKAVSLRRVGDEAVVEMWGR
jgi:hypothetical protein